VVNALDFGGITIRSKVQITMGVNNSLELHSWRKPDLINPCGGSALHRSGVNTRSCPSLEEGRVLHHNKNPVY
jgi:hypothetical protein